MGGGAPDVLFMGLDNSLAKQASTKALCRLTFFAHYWVDNRTGLDLSFHDHQSAPKSPVLLGARLPCDTTSVLAPGDLQSAPCRAGGDVGGCGAQAVRVLSGTLAMAWLSPRVQQPPRRHMQEPSACSHAHVGSDVCCHSLVVENEGPAAGSDLTHATTPNGTQRDVWGVDEAQEINVQPVLLNKQVCPCSCSCV